MLTLVHHNHKAPAYTLLALLWQIHRIQIWKLQGQPIALTQEHCVPEQEVQICPKGLLGSSRAEGVPSNSPRHI